MSQIEVKNIFKVVRSYQIGCHTQLSVSKIYLDSILYYDLYEDMSVSLLPKKVYLKCYNESLAISTALHKPRVLA